MSWLLRDDDVLAVIETRRKGWRAGIRGAVLLPSPVVLQTLVEAVPLDVAWCTRSAEGLKVRRMAAVKARRVSAPHLLPGVLVVASAGSFERWNLRVGDCLEVRET